MASCPDLDLITSVSKLNLDQLEVFFAQFMINTETCHSLDTSTGRLILEKLLMSILG